MKQAFPRRFSANHDFGYADSPRLARAVWMRVKNTLAPPNMTWYATDMEVLSPTSIRLFVYDIEDTFHGGIGERIFEAVITDFTDDEQAMLNTAVLEIYTEHAVVEFENRETQKYKNAVMAIRKEMFGV